jgi:oligoribonuclease NrnB/cAMP/cGMP phosphodiesterase (DHH superfamily)
MSKKITIFTDADLDGAGCVLIFKWLFPEWSISYKAVNERTFNEAFKAFTKTDNFTKTDRIYICDLNVIDQDINLLSDTRICYIDHHSTSFDRPPGFLGGVLCEASPSCASLVYKLVKVESNIELNQYQKLLLALIDDYDDYTLKYKFSLQLNTVFYGQQGDRIQGFCEKFKDGFKGFDAHQTNIVHYHELKVNQIFENLNVFTANLSLDGKPYKLMSTFADYAINEVASHLIKKYNADIAIVINDKTNAVSFRKKRGLDYDISRLAKLVADGAGNANAAGGKLTDKMLVFSKTFQPV